MVLDTEFTSFVQRGLAAQDAANLALANETVGAVFRGDAAERHQATDADQVIVRRKGHPVRSETALPGSGFMTPTGLMHDLLEWLDAGKTWDDIAPGTRRVVARDLRTLADVIDIPSTALPDVTDREVGI